MKCENEGCEKGSLAGRRFCSQRCETEYISETRLAVKSPRAEADATWQACHTSERVRREDTTRLGDWLGD